MTPARRAEIRAYIARLDLDQLPGWTVEQAIIRDLFEALPGAWREGYVAAIDDEDVEPWNRTANPYRDRADVS